MATLGHNLKIFLRILRMVHKRDPHTVMILSGSTSLALQGVKIRVHDIDIVTDEKGAKLLDEILRDEHQTTQLRYSGTEKYRSWYCQYALDGCDIDVMGEFQYKLKRGGWSTPNHLHEVHYIEYHGEKIPVLYLEQEIEEYKNTNRLIKVAKIRAAMWKMNRDVNLK